MSNPPAIDPREAFAVNVQYMDAREARDLADDRGDARDEAGYQYWLAVATAIDARDSVI